MLPTRRLRVAVSITAGLAVLTLSGCTGNDSSGFGSTGAAPQVSDREKTKVIEPAQREPAPQINGTTLDGSKLSLDSYEGEVVLLNFWGSWCGPCRDEVPVLQKVQRKTEDQGVRIVGVNVLDSKANAKAFVRNFEIEYPSIYDQPGRVALNFRGTVPPQSYPSTIIIDRQGRIAGRIIGEVHYDRFMPVVQRVAGEGERGTRAHGESLSEEKPASGRRSEKAGSQHS